MFTRFYNGSIRRMVVAFGSLFNQIYIDRTESDGQKTLLVPISYAPKEKYKVRLAGDPYLNNPNQITLPRIAFEITGYAYDANRKRNSVTRHMILPTTGNPSGVDYTHADWGKITHDQVSVQKWKDGKVVHERFYYGT